MSRVNDDPPPPRSRWRDVWQLHVPLVLVLGLCTVATVIEARRAEEGVWRAWAYMVEWPLIGAFAVWIWYRYRHEGRVTTHFADKWKARVEQITAEADAEAAMRAANDTAAGKLPVPESDAELQAWQAYVEDLERRQPPGGPPRRSTPPGR